VGKYEPLKAFLRAQPASRIPVRFAEIEKLLGFKLPPSKRYPAWWSNNPSNNTMTKVWLDAGFITESVDTASERLVFRRVERDASPVEPKAMASSQFGGGVLERLRASLAGTVRFAPGFDPTEPSGEPWDAERS
jgi:hypothetical protein